MIRILFCSCVALELNEEKSDDAAILMQISERSVTISRYLYMVSRNDGSLETPSNRLMEHSIETEKHDKAVAKKQLTEKTLRECNHAWLRSGRIYSPVIRRVSFMQVACMQHACCYSVLQACCIHSIRMAKLSCIICDNSANMKYIWLNGAI